VRAWTTAPAATVPTDSTRLTLDAWVEAGKPPDSMIAARMKDGVVERTRPVSVSKVAIYRGEGSTDDAANFVCAAEPQPESDCRVRTHVESDLLTSQRLAGVPRQHSFYRRESV
jgi:hypothetical protein